MSNEEEDSVWFTIAEKALGLLIVLIGIIIIYSTTIITYSTTTTPAIFVSGAFTVGGLAMIIVGAFMFLSKIRE